MWQFKSTQDSKLLHALVVFEACYSHIVPSMGGCGQIQLCSWLCQLPHSLPCCKGHGGKMSRQDLGFVSRVGCSRYRPSSRSSLPELVAEDVKKMGTTCQALPHHISLLFGVNKELGSASTEKSAEYLAPGDAAPLGSGCPCPSCAFSFFLCVRTRFIKEHFALRLFCRKSGALLFW